MPHTASAHYGRAHRHQAGLAAAAWIRRGSACVRPDRADRGIGRLRPHRQSADRSPERIDDAARGMVGRPERGRDARADRHRSLHAPPASARCTAEAGARVPRRGAFALPHGAARRHHRRAREPSRTGSRGRRCGDARRGGRTPARLRGRPQRARQGDARALRAGAGVLADDRQGAPTRARGRRSAQLGGAAARHRQARGRRGDPQQAGSADRRGAAGDPPSPGAGRATRRAVARLARRLDGRDRRPPRALGRHGLPEGRRGRPHLAGRAHRGRRGRVRRDDLRALVQGARRRRSGPRRDCPLRRRAVRPACRASVPEHLAWPAATGDGAALVARAGPHPRADPPHSRRGDHRELRAGAWSAHWPPVSWAPRTSPPRSPARLRPRRLRAWPS